MIRLIGGVFKNHEIKTEPLLGKDTRPSLAIVRKSLFDLLGEIEGCRCLDLFAGSGVLGMESLSRGADFAFFIDKEKIAAMQIKKNLEDMNLTDRSEVHNTDYRMALKALSKRGEKFDVIFLDPPYRFTRAYDSVNHVINAGILAKEGKGVLLSSSLENIDIGNAIILKDKMLTQTRITIFKGV